MSRHRRFDYAEIARAWVDGEPTTKIATRVGASRNHVIRIVKAELGHFEYTKMVNEREHQRMLRARERNERTSVCESCGANKHPNSRSQLCEACGLAKRNARMGWTTWTPGEITDRIREWNDLHGRAPTQRDWSKSYNPDRSAHWPSTSTVRHHFGTWNVALEAAGVEHRPKRAGRRPKR